MSQRSALVPFPKVKEERTGWRDAKLSDRHRRWGWNCPAVDLDFLFLEYDKGKAVAIVEYKHEKATLQWRTHPTYRAMIDLANRAKIPCFFVRYAGDFSEWIVTGLNPYAKRWVSITTRYSEQEWVTLLYRIRGHEPEPDLFEDMEIPL